MEEKEKEKEEEKIEVADGRTIESNKFINLKSAAWRMKKLKVLFDASLNL